MKKIVVYIDDEEDLCETFSDLFEVEGIKILTFSEPADGLSFVNSNRVDLLFLDFNMPSFTGDMLAGQIKEKLPIVLLTGDMSVETGYNYKAILPKPFDIAAITALLQSIL